MVPRTLADLEASLHDVRRSPADEGTLQLIVRRPRMDQREPVQSAELDTLEGLVGDSWRARGNRHGPDGSPDPDAQLTLMNARVAVLLAGTLEAAAVAGDQLYVDLDLSQTNLPTGTRLAIGAAEVEVSATPHTGCAKFSSRFGVDALKLVSTPEGRAMRLRGVNTKVVRAGAIRVGDRVAKR